MSELERGDTKEPESMRAIRHIESSLGAMLLILKQMEAKQKEIEAQHQEILMGMEKLYRNPVWTSPMEHK